MVDKPLTAFFQSNVANFKTIPLIHTTQNTKIIT